MKILHAAAFYGQTAGGFIPMLHALATVIHERGDTFTLVVPFLPFATWYPSMQSSGATIVRVRDAREAARTVSRERPDIVHTHFFGWEPAITRAVWASPMRLFWHVHSTSSPRGTLERTPKKFMKYRMIGSRVERFIVVSDAVGDEIVRLGALRSKVVTIHNEIDLRRFRPPNPVERKRARDALQLNSGPALLFYGRDPSLKGADVLISALKRLSACVTVVAVATPEDICRELEQIGRVVRVPYTDDVLPLLWAADALAAPSRGEGFGLSVAEAAATGLPIAASDLAAIREACGTYAAVRYAPPANVHAFSAALQQALAFGRTSAESGADGTGPAHWASRVVTLYDSPPS